ncbi:class A beta-lactamase [Acidisoma cellulosilytica]|uniref:Beta-lactamase n=1 Tax=Acidisoma cellulosilyticum TaxID=2802395 RepID=A0A964E4X9_9PROT|nr:class A beta-lactamase [Acidisoma cellulosilyticum]MCB8881956.1 class A beta-lactamase [Acidisoma cellulosilyticum]
MMATVIAVAASPARAATATDAIAALERQNGGRLGVFAVDTGTRRSIAYRAGERFPLCSTHKLLTVAAVLHRVDEGKITLDRPVPYGQADLLDYAPITRKNLGAGFMTAGALCAAAIDWSDNTAEDLLLGLIGGAQGWTRFARSLGDKTSRLDRTEPTLNTAIPGDPRDTTTPEAMVADLDAVLLGDALRTASRAQLNAWLLSSSIDGNLIRAGLPQGWRVGDKSGSGGHGTRNDIGIIYPPNAAPILAAVYYTETTQPLAGREKLIAETGRIIAQAFG